MPVQACPRGQQHHRSLDCDAAPHGVEHRGGFGRQLSRRASKLSRACLKPLRPTELLLPGRTLKVFLQGNYVVDGRPSNALV